jgi:hypothetical protein
VRLNRELVFLCTRKSQKRGLTGDQQQVLLGQLFVLLLLLLLSSAMEVHVLLLVTSHIWIRCCSLRRILPLRLCV